MIDIINYPSLYVTFFNIYYCWLISCICEKPTSYFLDWYIFVAVHLQPPNWIEVTRLNLSLKMHRKLRLCQNPFATVCIWIFFFLTLPTTTKTKICVSWRTLYSCGFRTNRRIPRRIGHKKLFFNVLLTASNMFFFLGKKKQIHSILVYLWHRKKERLGSIQNKWCGPRLREGKRLRTGGLWVVYVVLWI